MYVIGGGAAGMMAAITCAEFADVTIVEHNEKLGKKIYITGKGRCNLTNNCDAQDVISNTIRNPKFLFSAVYGFDSYMVMDFFEGMGLKLKTERGKRVFPVSDHSSDVIKTLQKALHNRGVKVLLNKSVINILCKDNKVTGIETNDHTIYEADAVILASGGASYPSTGSDGSGYKLAEKCGHTISRLTPSLVGIKTKEEYVANMAGLSLKNIKMSVYNGDRKVFEDVGEMLFTHTGISGPLCLSASSIANESLFENDCDIYIDLKFALSYDKLDERILRDWQMIPNKEFKNSLNKLLPSAIIDAVILQSKINPQKKVHDINKEERKRLLETLKGFKLTSCGLCGFKEAVITRGGILVSEVDPNKMQSKIVNGLYFAGEILDVDALTGGFNLQIAFSTGHLAGLYAGKDD